MALPRFVKILITLLWMTGGIANAQYSYKIGFLPSTTNQALTQAWRLSMILSLKRQDATFLALDPQMKAETQVSMMEDLIKEGYNAIILQPIDASLLAEGVKKAEAKGIHVITLNTDIPLPHAAHVTMDDYGAGQLVGEAIGKSINGKGNVAIIQSPPGALAGVQREKGFRAVMTKFPAIKIVDAQNGEWSKDKATEVMKNFLQANKELDAVFAVNDNMAEGAMLAAESAGRGTQVKIWGFNGQKSTLALIEEGRITGSAYTNAYKQGMTAAIHAVELLTNKKKKGSTTEVITIPPFAATKQTVDQIHALDRW